MSEPTSRREARAQSETRRRRGPSTSPRGRRPALDGIRGLSVLAVMIYHANATWLSGGFLSVNVFFVLSGYLITGLLLKEISARGTIDLARFYVNRARRLFPALLLAIVAISMLGAIYLRGGAAQHLRGDGLATLFYVANWRFVALGESYFAASGDPSPFRHMWTLAIEEQFYLIFPLLLLGIIRLARGRRRHVVRWLGVLIAASLLWQGWLYLTAIAHQPVPDPSRIYYGTDARANELLLGSALAVAMTYWNTRNLGAHPRRWTIVGAVAAAGMVALFSIPNETTAWIFLGGGFVFSALVGVLIVSVEVAPTSAVGRVFGWRPLAYIGEISYGLYLWHWPLFVLLSPERTGLSTWPLLALRLGLTLVIAVLSYHLVEQPIRQRRLHRRLGTKRSAIAWALVVPVTLLGIIVPTQTFISPGATDLTDARAGQNLQVSYGKANARERILVIGDSVGYSLAKNFPTSRYQTVALRGNVSVGCGTAAQWLVVNGVPQSQSNPECPSQWQQWKTASAQFNPTTVVWSMGGWDVLDHVIAGRTLRVGTPAYATYYRSQLERGLALLPAQATLVIPQVPCYRQPQFIVEGQDIATDRNDPQRARALNRVITEFAAAHPGRVRTPHPGRWLCPNGTYQDRLDGQQMRFDGVHYTRAGAEKFWAWLMPQVRS